MRAQALFARILRLHAKISSEFCRVVLGCFPINRRKAGSLASVSAADSDQLHRVYGESFWSFRYMMLKLI